MSKLTRRELLKGMVAVAAIPAIPEAKEASQPVALPCLYRKYAKHLSALTELDRCITEAANHPADENDAAKLVELWAQADSAIDKLKRLIQSYAFEQKVMVAVVGKAAWEAACDASFAKDGF